MEKYLNFIINILNAYKQDEKESGVIGEVQPLYGIFMQRKVSERDITNLSGYRGFGPVRLGNAAYSHTIR